MITLEKGTYHNLHLLTNWYCIQGFLFGWDKENLFLNISTDCKKHASHIVVRLYYGSGPIARVFYLYKLSVRVLSAPCRMVKSQTGSYNTGFRILFKITLKSVRRQRKSLTAQLNSTPVRRIDLYAKVRCLRKRMSHKNLISNSNKVKISAMYFVFCVNCWELLSCSTSFL